MPIAPHWRVNKVTLTLAIIVDDVPRVVYQLPRVCDAYKGDAKDRVIREEAAKLQTLHATELGKIAHAWAVKQPLTERDRVYVKAHRAWLARAGEFGVEDPIAAKRYDALSFLERGVTAAGWHALKQGTPV
jgi:uncharacterized protein (DUF924 family)